MGALRRLTWLARVTIAATIVSFVAAVATNSVALYVVFAGALTGLALLVTWNDPGRRMGRGDDPAKDAEQRWNLD